MDDPEKMFTNLEKYTENEKKNAIKEDHDHYNDEESKQSH